MKNHNKIINLKKNALLLLMPFVFFIAADAQAGEQRTKNSSSKKNSGPVYKTNFYAKFLGGANFLQNTSIEGNKSTYQTGYIFAGSFGNCWRRYGLCLEAEYAFRRNAIENIHFLTQGVSKDGHFETSSYMVNLLWDLLGCGFWKIQPFIGGGLGYDFQQMHAANSRIDFYQKWHQFSWQVMAGFAYRICRNTEITLEYKFHEGGHFNNNSIGVGLAYKFGFLK